MSKTKRTNAGRYPGPGTNTGKRRPPSPYLNRSEVRGLLGPGAAPGSGGPGADNRGMFSFLDQWGGLDGIMNTMGKVQRMMRMIQSFGPLLNMFGSFGSFFGGGKASTAGLPAARRPVRQPKRGPSSTKGTPPRVRNGNPQGR
ncbi:hypothetical protein [Paenibacillus sp. GYB003]|uniref:hypothetical protein n=1 Tax=Paenibacillus sp. GYB003 TaxID=2994392 RepID=UPI002F96B084